eukprot:377339-Hanusia_phi.AAC.2
MRRHAGEGMITQQANHGIHEMMWPINLRGSHWITLHIHLELQLFQSEDASMAQPMNYDQVINLALAVVIELGKIQHKLPTLGRAGGIWTGDSS